MEFLGTAIEFVQVPMYGGLIYIIAQKKYSLKELMTFLVVGILLLIGYVVSGQAAYFKGFLLIIASKNIPYRSVLMLMQLRLPNTVGLFIEVACGAIVYAAVNMAMKNALIFEIIEKIKSKILCKN